MDYSEETEELLTMEDFECFKSIMGYRKWADANVLLKSLCVL